MTVTPVLAWNFLRVGVEQRDAFRRGIGCLPLQLSLALRGIIIAACIIRDGAVMVAACSAIGASEVLHGIGQIGVRIEQALRGAGVAEACLLYTSDAADD